MQAHASAIFLVVFLRLARRTYLLDKDHLIRAIFVLSVRACIQEEFNRLSFPPFISVRSTTLRHVFIGEPPSVMFISVFYLYHWRFSLFSFFPAAMVIYSFYLDLFYCYRVLYQYVWDQILGATLCKNKKALVSVGHSVPGNKSLINLFLPQDQVEYSYTEEASKTCNKGAQGL